MFSVYQHWDPLKVCIVGRSYPPEFYSWIKISHVRKLFEKIAIETEEDYQNLIKKLESFGVQILRPNLPKDSFVDGRYVQPPMCPRDVTIMIGQTFYTNNTHIEPYRDIVNFVKSNHNRIQNVGDFDISGATVTRLGKDLYFGTPEAECKSINEETEFYKSYKSYIKKEFLMSRNHIINTQGHNDGTFCPVCPGLIISIRDIPTYKDTFPGWEVVYLPNQSWLKIQGWLTLKYKNQGKWWIPGFEHDQDVVSTVQTWLAHWTGYVEETVFDVNMLIVDPKNVIVFGYNKQVFDALERYGITPHIVPIRHRYFWDGGIHCFTSDLHREGTQQDYFPERDN